MKKIVASICLVVSATCAFAGDINVNLEQCQDVTGEYGRVYFSAENSTEMNFAELAIQVTYIDQDGYTLNGTTVSFMSLRPGRTVRSDTSFVGTNCEEIRRIAASVQFAFGNDMQLIDGAEIEEAIVFTSRVKGLDLTIE